MASSGRKAFRASAEMHLGVDIATGDDDGVDNGVCRGATDGAAGLVGGKELTGVEDSATGTEGVQGAGREPGRGGNSLS